ncbi:hypothetical protein HDU76_007828 [Blyttiomyces sp. JEL0837]|nr:hypothetical protein HDU76_007828 [Blyttiomyces sp. JEL0837]
MKKEKRWKSKEAELTAAVRDVRRERDAADKEKYEQTLRLDQTMQELKALKKEKASWEKRQKAAEMIPTKRYKTSLFLSQETDYIDSSERQDLELLKSQKEELQKQVKQLEHRNAMNVDRLQKRIDELTLRTSELREEIQILEEERARWIMSEPNFPSQCHHSVAPVAKSPPLSVEHRTPQPLVRRHVPEKSPPESEMSRHQPFSLEQARQALIQFRRQYNLGTLVHENYLKVEGKLVHLLSSGTTLCFYPPDTIKEKLSDGYLRVYYGNGDFRETNGAESVYWYAKYKILDVIKADGLKIREFKETGQIEKFYPDGTQEFIYNDGTVKYVFANGSVSEMFCCCAKL